MRPSPAAPSSTARRPIPTRLRLAAVVASLGALVASQVAALEPASAATVSHSLRVGHAMKPGSQIHGGGAARLVVQRSGGVYLEQHHHKTWLAKPAKTATSSRSTRLALHRDGTLTVERGHHHVLKRYALTSSRVSRLTLTSAGRLTLWQGTTRVAVTALPAPVAPVASSDPSPAPVESAPVASTPVASAPVASSPVVSSPVATGTPVSVNDPTASAAPAPVASTAPAGLAYALTTSYVGGGSTVNIRTAPSLSATIATVRSPGTAISIVCQTIGDRYGSGTYADNRTWDQLTGADTGHYVHDVLTTTPGGTHVALADGGYSAFSPNIPQCAGTVATPVTTPTVTRESKAVAWAQTQIGQTSWAGLCEGFVETALGARGQYYSAEKDYLAQQAAGRLHPASDTNPPAGALVFYDYGGTSGLGHVSLSIGGGQTISSFGTEGSGKKVAQVSVTGRGLPYLGWAYAPDGWPGR